jgi:hypothetical protein
MGNRNVKSPGVRANSVRRQAIHSETRHTSSSKKPSEAIETESRTVEAAKTQEKVLDTENPISL